MTSRMTMISGNCQRITILKVTIKLLLWSILQCNLFKLITQTCLYCSKQLETTSHQLCDYTFAYHLLRWWNLVHLTRVRLLGLLELWLFFLSAGTVYFDEHCQWQDGEGLHYGQRWSRWKNCQLFGTFTAVVIHPSTSAASSDYWWRSGVKEGTLTQLL